MNSDNEGDSIFTQRPIINELRYVPQSNVYTHTNLDTLPVKLAITQKDNKSIISTSEDNKDNNSGKSCEYINIDNIMYDVIMNNKIIFFATLPLFIGYYLQDTIFTRSVAAFTSNIPGFVKDIDFKKILIMLLPYIVAMILFYISSVVTSKAMTRIE